MNDLELIKTNELQSVNLNKELFYRWIDYLDATLKTVETYTRAIRQFNHYLQAHNISQPKREDILAYKEELSKDRKATTVNAYLMAVKQFFKWTDLEGFYPDVTKNIKSKKIEEGFKKDYLTTAQVKKLLHSVDCSSLGGLRDYAILILMITTGLRTIEIVRANVEDLRTVGDFRALFIQGKGKTEKTAYIKITPPVEEAIGAYLKARGSVEGKQPLFTSNSNRDNNSRLTTRSVSRIAKNHLNEAELISDRLTAHSLRHTTATLNLLAGASVEETQQLLRHSNINTTLIYSHALERAKNNSEQRITDFIFSD